MDQKKSKEYWEKRARENENKVYKKASDLKKELDVHYIQAKKEIQKSINDLIARYMFKTDLSYADAMKYLTSKEFRMSLEEYEFLAKIDSRTSEICKKLNGEKFKVKDARAGVNYPPMHPHCRSTTVAVLDFDNFGKGKNALHSKSNSNNDEDSTFKFIEKIDNVDYNIAKDIFEKYEKDMVKQDYETAIVILQNGEIYKVDGKKGAVNPYVIGKSLKRAYITHNHPMSETEYTFSNEDLNLFINEDLEYLRGCDEKYIYELSKNLFKGDELDWNIQLTPEFALHTLFISKAEENNLSYRRYKNGK